MIRVPITDAELDAFKRNYRAHEYNYSTDDLSKPPELLNSGGCAYLIFDDNEHMERWYLCGS